MDGERLYTLAEAALENKRQECARFGHDYNTIVAIGYNRPHLIICHRCGESWNVMPPDKAT